MRENYYFSMGSSFPFKSQTSSEYQSKKIHPNHTYIFPNSPQTQKHNHFKTSIQIPRKEMADYYTKKLSMLNRSSYIINLKQIKKQQCPDPHKASAKLFLYYELVPYSMQYAKEGSVDVEVSVNKFEIMLRELFTDLIQSNIYCLVNLSNCGFTETGQFRVYIPPTIVFRDKKLTANEKQSVFKSCQQLLFYYESDIPKSIQTIPVEPPRPSKRLNSPQNANNTPQFSKIEEKDRKESDPDVKKTLKIAKNGIPEFINKIQQAKAKAVNAPILKKAKSMEIIMNQGHNKQTVKFEHRGSQNYMEKIKDLNQKLNSIKQTFNRKISAGQQMQKLRKKNSNDNNMKYLKQEVIYDFYNPTANQGKKIDQYEQIYERQSVDTYDQQMNNEYKMPSFKPSHQMRRTALPRHLAEQSKKPQERQRQWNHESAGNVMFKKILQKNRQAYPELFEGERTDHSKISMHQPSHSNITVNQPNRLKKMMSLETFDQRLETNSIHLSDYSKELSNVKRRKQKQLKSKQIKQKVQDILMKSKRAIELLKSPGKYHNF